MDTLLEPIRDLIFKKIDHNLMAIPEDGHEDNQSSSTLSGGLGLCLKPCNLVLYLQFPALDFGHLLVS